MSGKVWSLLLGCLALFLLITLAECDCPVLKCASLNPSNQNTWTSIEECKRKETEFKACLDETLSNYRENCECPSDQLAIFAAIKSLRLSYCGIVETLTRTLFLQCYLVIKSGIQRDRYEIGDWVVCMQEVLKRDENLSPIASQFNYDGNLLQDIVHVLQEMQNGCPLQETGKCLESLSLQDWRQQAIPDVGSICQNVDLYQIDECIAHSLPAHLCQNTRGIMRRSAETFSYLVSKACEGVAIAEQSCRRRG